MNIVTAAPNQAVIVSGIRGQRVIIGGCASVLWCVETYDRLYLDLMTLSVDSSQAETAKGVRISLSSTAQIKIMSGDGHKIDYDKVKLAATHFLGKKRSEIQDAVHRTMEGHQRQVIGTLTVEELYKDRASFSERVKELVDPDLLGMGFQLVSYTVTEVDDTEGYITALGKFIFILVFLVILVFWLFLVIVRMDNWYDIVFFCFTGATQTASVKREAEEGRAKNESQARIIVAKAKAEAQIAEADAQRTSSVRANEFAATEAESKSDLQMKQQGFQKEVNEATARAEAAIRIETAIQNQKVVKQQTMQKVEEAEVMLQVTEREMARAKAEAEGASGAKLIEQKNDSESRRVAAEAEAFEKTQLGEAEAAAIRAKGNAEAAVIREKQQAYPNYAEERMVSFITEKLPAIAEAVAAPLKNAGKMTFVSSDGSAGSRLTNDISQIMGQLPDTVEALTGVNLKRVMKRLEGPVGAAVKTAVEATD